MKKFYLADNYWNIYSVEIVQLIVTSIDDSSILKRLF